MLSIICCISSICTADQETQEENTVNRHLEKKEKQEIDGPGCSYFEAATPNNPALSAELWIVEKDWGKHKKEEEVSLEKG